MNKKIISAVLALVIGVAIIGAYYYPKFPISFGSTNAAAGTTFGSAKVAQVNITPSTALATSSSILNTDATDRWISSSYVACDGTASSKTYLTGTGLATFSMQIATTATAAQVGNVNYAGNLTVATSTPDTFVSSTTEGVIQGTSRVWPTGTYLTFSFNATNTAVCTAGVHYVGS